MVGVPFSLLRTDREGVTIELLTGSMRSFPQRSPKTGQWLSPENRPTIEARETLTATSQRLGSVAMSNVLSEEKKQQVIALGRLGWSLRRIEEATGVRRETVGDYLRKAGVVVHLPGILLRLTAAG